MRNHSFPIWVCVLLLLGVLAATYVWLGRVQKESVFSQQPLAQPAQSAAPAA